METVLKFFPFMPKKSETTKFIVALLMYFVVFPTVNVIICSLLGASLILSPIAIIIGGVGGLYTFVGLVFSILCFAGVVSK